MVPAFHTTVGLAFPGLEDALRADLTSKGIPILESSPFFILPDQFHSPWLKDHWRNSQKVSFESITEAQKILKAQGARWANLPTLEHRRAALISEKLLPVKGFKSPIEFDPEKAPVSASKFGVFALMSRNELIYSISPTAKVPFGVFDFKEDKSFPPNRAYLKLWELFTFHIRRPSKGEICVDLGGCPGGWTWVLQTLGAQVHAIDRSPLDAKVLALPRVSFKKGDAFSCLPNSLEQTPNWIFWDVICAPEKLFQFVQAWVQNKNCPNLVFTIKFQDKAQDKKQDKTPWIQNMEIQSRFESIPDSKLIHLNANKHELTWIYPWSRIGT